MKLSKMELNRMCFGELEDGYATFMITAKEYNTLKGFCNKEINVSRMKTYAIDNPDIEDDIDIKKELNLLVNYQTKRSFGIKEVIFNNPATIVIWTDGTKTVVKRQKGDKWDKEKGLAMAIAKKVFGNKGAYCNQFKKWVNTQEK